MPVYTSCNAARVSPQQGHWLLQREMRGRENCSLPKDLFTRVFAVGACEDVLYAPVCAHTGQFLS